MTTVAPSDDVDVFLSYAREDARLARRLVEALVARRGWLVWWDTRLRSGEQFAREIQRALGRARCVVVLWSKHSSESDWIAAEASEGWERGVLVPVLLDDCVPPMPFRQTQATDLSAWNGSTAAPEFQSLLEDVQRALARGSAVSPAEIQSRERRRRRMVRRRALRFVWPMALAIVIASGLGMFFRQAESNREADALAARSESIIEDLLAEFRDGDRTWWAFLMGNSDHMNQLSAGALFAVSGYETARTPRTRAALNEAWKLLPWADRQIEFDDETALSNLEYSHDGRFLAAGGGAEGTIILNAASDEIVARIPHGGLPPSDESRSQFDGRGRGALDYSPAENVLATAGPDNTVRLWNEDGEELARFEHGAPVTAAVFDTSGTLLVAADTGGNVILWDTMSGRSVQRFENSMPLSYPTISRNGTYVGAVAGREDAVVWRSSSGAVVAEIRHDPAWGSTSMLGFSVNGIAFTPDEKSAVTWGAPRATVVHDIESGAQIWQIDASSYGGPVFFDDGAVMVHPGLDLEWWDTATRSLAFSIPDAEILDIVAGPGGRLMGTVDAHQTTQIWDVQDRAEIKRVPYYRFNTTMAFTPDGSTVAFSGYDEYLGKRVIEIVEIVPDDLVEKICGYFGTDLSPAEWRASFADVPYIAACPSLVAD